MEPLKDVNHVNKKQLKLINDLLKEIVKTNSFYQKKYSRYLKKISTGIQSQQDFFSLPFIDRKELVANQLNNPPYGTNLTYSQKEYDYIKSTSGSSKNPRLHVVYTPQDLQRRVYVHGNEIKKIHNPNQRALAWVTQGASFYMLETYLYAGFEIISLTGHESYQEIIDKICFFNTKTLISTPTKIFALMNYIRDKNIDPKSLPLKTVIHLGEGYLENPTARKLVKKYLNANCFTLIGSTESGIITWECAIHRGNHLFNEGYIFEVINPKTLKHDTKGELVITSLWRKGFPLIRYRTGDLVEIDSSPCQCGYKSSVIKPASMQRLEFIYTINNASFSSVQFDESIRKFIGINNYLIKILKNKIIIKVEKHALTPEILDKLVLFLKNKLNTTIQLKFIKKDYKFYQHLWKFNRIYDARNKPEPNLYIKFIIKIINSCQNLIKESTPLHPW